MELNVYAWLLLIVNIAGFYIMGRDKKLARQHKYRIPERTLWLIAVFWGAVGMTLGMWHFRHKTKHFTFKYGLPILALLEIGLFIYFSVHQA